MAKQTTDTTPKTPAIFSWDRAVMAAVSTGAIAYKWIADTFEVHVFPVAERENLISTTTKVDMLSVGTGLFVGAAFAGLTYFMHSDRERANALEKKSAHNTVSEFALTGLHLVSAVAAASSVFETNEARQTAEALVALGGTSAAIYLEFIDSCIIKPVAKTVKSWGMKNQNV